jgi:single-strand DNA-binding protein
MINSTPAQLEHHHQWPHSSRSDPPRSVPGTSADSLTKGDRVIVLGQLRQRSWETPEGDKRSVVEVTAEEAGPSLRCHRQTPTRRQAQRQGRQPGQRRPTVLDPGHR